MTGGREREGAGGGVVVALGSNLGDRLLNLQRAVEALEDFLEIRAGSAVYETPAWEVGEQPAFLNAVVVGCTGLAPLHFLERLLRTEEKLGRRRREAGSARTIDLDLILYGDRIVREEGLCVPHPRWRERTFVLAPLAEISPGLRDPETGCTVKEILSRWPAGPREIRRVAAELSSPAPRGAS